MVTLIAPKMFEHKSDNGSDSPAEDSAHDESRLAALSTATTRDLVQLFKLLGQSQPAVSHHLALLREDGIIACRRDGKHNFYHIVPKRMQAYLDLLFGASQGETKKVRIENALLTYGRDGE